MAFVYCEECGREISDKAKFCPNCGCAFKIKGRGFAITSMVLGIIACTCSLPVILATVFSLIDQFNNFAIFNSVFNIIISATTLIVGTLSLVFGIISVAMACKLKKSLAGISLGSISTVICLICLIISIVLVSA